MNTRNRKKTLPSSRAIMLAALGAGIFGLFSVSAQAQILDLADKPLFGGSGVAPNVMVAVDDSGSMDFELLFASNEGLLYWNGTNESAVDSQGNFQSSGPNYGYLFPDGRQLRSDADAVPPVPQLAFARSPEYNKAYFDPSAEYDPWVTMGDVDWKAAPNDPINESYSVDLTGHIRKYGNSENFLVGPGMTIPKDTFINSGNGWQQLDQDNSYNSFNRIGIEYFPATFYLRQSTPLPQDFGYLQPLYPPTGLGPEGEILVRYEIRPDNFTSVAAYNDAIQNFANWFTYYRKRHLATRGGIAAAFNSVGGMRAGHCTINGREALTMRDLNDGNARVDFYSSIFNIDYSVARGTPNRKALQFLGEQLENNESIIQSPCQQNFAILFTDGYNTGGPLTNLGNVDGDFGPPFSDSYSNTIADVAMEYYTNLGGRAAEFERSEVPVPDACNDSSPDKSLDCQRNLHMTTFGVTLGQQGVIFGNPNFPQENADPYNNFPNWPQPGDSANSSESGPPQIDDLWHATINSRGQMLNARTPQEIATAFAAVLENIANPVGSGSAFAANSSSFSEGSAVYQASFNTGSWTGDVKAFALGDDINDVNELWRASTQLSGVPPDQRTILTTRNNRNKRTSNDEAAAFRYGELRQQQQADLTEAQLNYIRGDRSQERSQDGGTFRNRAGNIVGDIVHSDPTYVGAPNRFRFPDDWTDLRYPNASMPEDAVGPYSDPGSTTAFAQQNVDRDPMLYVGANDGMLHGFDAETGEERVAFVPDAVIPNLAALTDPNYTHRYYVDGSPVVGDVVFDNAWHTVLVSGLGNGGNSVFALDVTDPTAFSETQPEATVLWEYTDDQMGRTFGKPSIVRLHDGRWAAMVASGYADKKVILCHHGMSLPYDDHAVPAHIGHGDTVGACDKVDGNGKKDTDPAIAALYLIDIETGDLIERIETGGSSLSEPFPVDLDGDFITDYAYAGDLEGNVWKFDLTADNSAPWSVSKLFTATDTDGNRQPITTQPQVGVHPYGEDFGLMVYFGTGKYLEDKDAGLDSSLSNSVYGIWDQDVFTFNEANDGEPLFSPGITTDIPRDRLTRQTVVQEAAGNSEIYRIVSDNAVDYQETSEDTDNKRGWVLDLPPATGELIISNPRIQGDTFAFSTTIPNPQVCKPGGSGFFMLVDLATGGRTGFPALDLNGDNQFVSGDDTVELDGENVSVSGVQINQGAPGAGTFLIDYKKQSDRVTLPTSDGSIIQLNVNVGRKPDRRRSWREIRR